MLAFLGLASLVARLSSACTCDTNCTDVRDKAHGVWCLEDCGFAILKDVYDKGFLDEIQKGFAEWHDRPQVTSAFGHSNSRSPFVELGFPNTYPFNQRDVFYNRKVSQMMEKYYEHGNTTLETVTFLHNPMGSSYQSWHMDNLDLPAAIKVYAPLADVSLDMGPIEMSVSKYDLRTTVQMVMEAESSDEDTYHKYQKEYGDDGDYTFAKHKGLVRDCTVKGNFERGTIMAYTNGVYHRGTPNLSGRNRTVLMYSYMTTMQADLYKRDLKMFKPKVQALLHHYQHLYHKYRDEDQELLRKELDAAKATAASSQSTSPAPKGHLEPFGGWKEGVPVEQLYTIPEPREFYDRYAKSDDGQGRPVVFRAAANSMQAMQWTDHQLLERYGSERISGVEHDLKEARTGGNVDGMTVMADFLNAYNTSDIYMVSRVPKAMKRDVNFLPCLRCGGYLKLLNANKLWMGRGGSKSLIHYDDQDNINCLFSGRKRFVLMHPRYKVPFEAHANTEKNRFGWIDVDLDSSMPGYGGYMRADVDKMDLIKYPGWSDVDWSYAELEPGDCIYIPFQWYHQVTAASVRSINVHVWFGMPSDFDEEDCNSSTAEHVPTFADCTWGWSREEGHDRPTKCHKLAKRRKSASSEL